MIVFLAQALLALTRIPTKPAYDIETKITSDAMEKLTLTVKHEGIGGTKFILSDFNAINKAIMMLSWSFRRDSRGYVAQIRWRIAILNPYRNGP